MYSFISNNDYKVILVSNLQNYVWSIFTIIFFNTILFSLKKNFFSLPGIFTLPSTLLPTSSLYATRHRHPPKLHFFRSFIYSFIYYIFFLIFFPSTFPLCLSHSLWPIVHECNRHAIIRYTDYSRRLEIKCISCVYLHIKIFFFPYKCAQRWDENRF